jgi:hypothetical protein
MCSPTFFRDVCVLLSVITNLAVGVASVCRSEVRDIFFPGASVWAGYMTVEVGLLEAAVVLVIPRWTEGSNQTLFPVLMALSTHSGLMLVFSFIEDLEPGIHITNVAHLPGLALAVAALVADALHARRSRIQTDNNKKRRRNAEYIQSSFSPGDVDM